MVLQLEPDAQPKRDFRKATAHEIAAILIGQNERIISLLTRQHAEFPPLADTRAYVANTPQSIYTATRRQFLRIVAISASAAGNITLSLVHPTSGPHLWPVFVCQAAAAGPLPVGEHEFVMPQDAVLWAQADQSISLSITAAIFDGSEPSLIMNWEF